ncbi:small integral membrane protein 3 isoform X1 [Rattus norvegicus]|nr:small integral membrane protein 3 isoform X1 [Rattus norvegicus]
MTQSFTAPAAVADDLGFSHHHPGGGSQPPVTPTPENLAPGMHSYRQNMHTQKNKANMDAISQSPVDVLLPKHILDIWAIVLIILATVVIMTSLFLCPATAVIIYRMRTHPVLNGAV